MVDKRLINSQRHRTIQGSFAFIQHRFLRDGFWQKLSMQELVLYFFLVLVADQKGLSYYSYDKICAITGLNLDEYIQARDGLIDKDLLAFDGRLFQVLSLPGKPVQCESGRVPNQDELYARNLAGARRIRQAVQGR
jgi:hypothetical protein